MINEKSKKTGKGKRKHVSFESRLEQCAESWTLSVCCSEICNDNGNGNCLKVCHQSVDADFMDSITIHRRQRVSAL